MKNRLKNKRIPKERKAVAMSMLDSGRSVPYVAKETGISKGTLYSWARTPRVAMNASDSPRVTPVKTPVNTLDGPVAPPASAADVSGLMERIYHLERLLVLSLGGR